MVLWNAQLTRSCVFDLLADIFNCLSVAQSIAKSSSFID